MTSNGTSSSETSAIYKFSDKDGHFRRQASQFRNFVSSDPNAEFPAEKDRYVLYVNKGCPWAQRAVIVHKLKGLEEIVQVVTMGYFLTPEGWVYDGSPGSDPVDPIYGFTKHRQLYFKADPNYSGRFTVPALWDRKKETIVSNESSDIIRMFYTAFDAFVDPSLQEAAKPLFPTDKRKEMEDLNEWVYEGISNGAYKTGFATSQAAYDFSVHKLFETLDRLEERLRKTTTPYLFGDHVTDADIRVFPAIVRLDAAYHTMFKCNLKMIRHDYPRLHDWVRRLYWDMGKESNGGAFYKTTHWGPIKESYAYSLKLSVVPAGPKENILRF